MRRLLLALLLLAAPAHAVLIDSGNGNTSAPADDPGWANVGRVGPYNGAYLGYGWMISAAHVSIDGGKTVALDGALYTPVVQSRVVMEHDASHDADLHVFQIEPRPEHLPLLPIRATTPSLDTALILIGRGYDRGTFNPWGPGGWNWTTTRTMRWGTNHIGGVVEGSPLPVNSLPLETGSDLTQSLVVEFNENASGSDHEAIVTFGDSGGALFIENGSVWELAGISFAVSSEPDQPANTSIYGNDTFAVDLAHYRDQILDVVRPCDDGEDNDGDSLVDLADPGCLWEGDFSEEPACSDGIDNDWDGDVDHPDDPDCASADDLLEEPDLDGDLVPDDEDNCTEAANPSQLDSNQDGYGNACDADYDDDDSVGVQDFGILSGAYGASTGEPHFDEDVDADGDGFIGIEEFALLSNSWSDPPGPSGLSCAGSIPCP
jgi:hypothetical protein